MKPQRKALLARIAAEVEAEVKANDARPILRVAIDGVDGAGKTRFADELASLLGDAVIRASVDSFHNPRSIRYAAGKRSPEGFFNDSFNYPKLREILLDPLSAHPPRPYCCACFDHRTDSSIPADWKDPPGRGILIFDGIFAHRPELFDYWDYSVFLDVSPETSVKRCIEREEIKNVSYDPADPVHARYVKGQRIYLDDVDPSRKCTRHIVNEDIDAPKLVD